MKTPNISVLRPGELFHARYRVLRCIAAGGMGAVYEVKDERTDAHRALKVMLPTLVEDADMRSRFEREARVTANIESDHIVRVLDAAIDAETGTPFLVMDLLHGKDLRAILKERVALPAPEVLTYLHQAALALDKTHAAGVVHRDLKPDNLFITQRDDGTPCVKILDFGIAKIVVESNSPHATKLVGTPVYMSPEQIRGNATLGPRSDLYALGHIAYTLLTGEAYWKEESRASESMFPLLERLLQGAVEPASARAQRRRVVALPPAFNAWFAKATALRPDERFDRATIAVSALAGVFDAGAPRPNPALPSSVPILEEVDRTTERIVAAAAPAPGTPTVADPTRTSTTSAAVSTDPRAPPGPRSRAPAVAGMAVGLAVLLGLGVLLKRSGPTTTSGAADTTATATPSAAVAAATSASASLTTSEEPSPAEVSPSASVVAAPSEPTAVPASASPSALVVPIWPKKPIAAPKTAPPPEPPAAGPGPPKRHGVL